MFKRMLPVALALLNGLALSSAAASEPEPSYRFASMPDYWNADVGDVTASPFYAPERPNSINDAYRAADEFILSTIQAEGVTDLYSAGDFVEGHWGIDTDATNTFGPVGTTAEMRAAVKLAGDTYYPQVMERFTSHGFTLYPALGDHEIGDNDWRLAKGGIEAFKYRNMSLYKQTYSRHLMQVDGVHRFVKRPRGQATHTAYAVRPHPEVQLVALDVFRRTSTEIVAEIDAAQLDWLKKVLWRAKQDGVDWIIVQGHTPIVSPVRKFASSYMIYKNGTNSALWRVMKRYGVDVYLAGEVHDVTGHHVDGIAQISHGGLPYRGNANYLVGEISGDTMTLTSKQFSGVMDAQTGRMWQTDMTKWKPISITYTDPPVVGGQMVITKDNALVSRSGSLDVYEVPAPR